MRRKLTTLLAKGGHSQNGSPRQLVDEAVYREHLNFLNAQSYPTGVASLWDPTFSGWSNASRPRDTAISLRPVLPVYVSPIQMIP